MAVRRFMCGSCEQVHTGLPEATFGRPDAIAAMSRAERAHCWETDDACAVRRPRPGLGWAVVRWLGRELAPIVGERARRWGYDVGRFYLRGVLRLPLLDPAEGDGDSFGFGLWAELAESDLRAEQTRRGPFAPFDGVLATELPGYPGSMGAPVRIEPQQVGQRPLFVCVDAGSRLAEEQRRGITTERGLEILRLSGMEPRWIGSGVWGPAEGGATVGGPGPDGGVVVRDEEYDGGARITLARGDTGGGSVTCGVYGLMVHTRFFSREEDAAAAVEAMKPDLAELADLASSEGAAEEAGRFVERFP